VILLCTLTASLLLLLPSQGRVIVGVEMLLIGALLIYRSVRTWPIVRAYTRNEAVISYSVGTFAHALLVAGALSVLARTGGGLYIVAAALLLELIRALSDIWVLFSGITTIAEPSRATDRRVEP
jgi:hypothetical protein